MSGDAETFDARLRAGRRAAGLTQEELAGRSGLSVRAIRDLESGRTRWPYPNSLHRLADALGLAGPIREEFIVAAGRRGSAGRVRPASRHAPVPRQLPGAAPGFVGRRDQLTALSQVLQQPGGTAVISAVGGTAGVGKTALAVQWAHEVARDFPDGQLFLNLRGFDPSGTPASPGYAVRVFLDALGVPADRMPRTLDAQLGLYRSLLAGQRMLIVLDNARDAAQVRPLLPGAPTCRVIITSRNQLTGLAATDAAHLLTLDVMTDAEATQLLLHRLGTRRLTAEAGAAARIIESAARLPLAICVVGARAAAQPELTLARVAAALDAEPGLDAFADRDPAADVRAALSWSYRQLDAPAARLFRLLGVHPGPDISAPATASLAAASLDESRRLLSELCRCHLLAEDGAGRFSFHDLLRSYAAELARASDDPADRGAAVRRALDHYQATAAAALLALNGRQLPADTPPLAAGVQPEPVPTRAAALDWFDREYPVLIRLVSLAGAAGFDVPAWQLPWLLASVFESQARWDDWEATHEIAMAAARRLGDQRAQALIHTTTGRCAMVREDLPAAEQHLQQALDLFEALGDVRWQAHVHINLGIIVHAVGRHRDASALALHAHELYGRIGDMPGQAGSLINLGRYSSHLGHHGLARERLTRALAMYRDLGDPTGQGTALANLGLASLRLGEYPEAIACYQAAADIFGDLGHPAHQAEALADLGEACRQGGQPDAAAQAWQQALAIYQQLGHPAAAGVRRQLDSLAARQSDPRARRPGTCR